MLRKRLGDDSGIALVMSLMVMTVLTIVTTSTIYYSTSGQNSSQLSLSRDGAYRLAEAGINNALAVLGSPPDPTTLVGNNALDPNVFCGISGKTYTSTSPCTIKDTYANGYVIWNGVLNSGTATWLLTSTGYVVNRNVKASTTYSIRKLTVSVAVHPTLTQPLNTPVWNYVYATKPASPVPTCDEEVSQSVTISSPFYVEGNLCLHNTATITRGPLVVKGRLIMDSASKNFAGTSGVPLSDAHIINGCSVANTTHTPCNWNGSTTVQGLDNLYATVLDATAPTGLSPPTPSWDNWYLNSSPGPYFPCQTISGQAPLSPLTFDNAVDPNPGATDAQKLTYQNNSIISPQDLTPGYDYRCKTAAGELSWNNTTKVLTIQGTIYIDGSVYVQNGSINRYTGQGVIYLGGTLFMKNSSLCGAIYNGACDLRPYQSSPAQGWDPNVALICFVAKGTGGQVATGDSVQLVSATLQGALYANGSIELGTTSNVDGPMVGYKVILGQSVTTSFPSITIVPNGMPSNPTAYAQIDPPSNYSG